MTPQPEHANTFGAHVIASELESRGLLEQTINGSDRPRIEAAEIIAKHIADLLTLNDYLVRKLTELRAELTESELKRCRPAASQD